MNEWTKKAALVSMEEWNAIHDEMRKTFSVAENQALTAEEFQAAAQQAEPPPLD